MAVLVATALAGGAGAEPPAPRQLIVVSSPAADSPVATLTAYQRDGAHWREVLGPVRADLGELGVGAPQDDVFRTPAGTFPLGQAFGREPNPGTRMPYFQATDEDWWDEDVDSPTYNTHVHAPEIDSDDAENLYDSGGSTTTPCSSITTRSAFREGRQAYSCTCPTVNRPGDAWP